MPFAQSGRQFGFGEQHQAIGINQTVPKPRLLEFVGETTAINGIAIDAHALVNRHCIRSQIVNFIGGRRGGEVLKSQQQYGIAGLPITKAIFPN